VQQSDAGVARASRELTAQARARTRSCGGGFLREIRERGGRIRDAVKVFDEMLARMVLQNARVLMLDEASRVQDAVRRMLQRRAGQRHAGRWRAVWRLRADSHGSSETPREGRRKPLKRKQRTRSDGTANGLWRIWKWPGASRPRSSRRQGGRVWRGETKAKVRTDLD
jgi:hypothetical protein